MSLSSAALLLSLLGLVPSVQPLRLLSPTLPPLPPAPPAAAVTALESVCRVRYSLPMVAETINVSADADAVSRQIKALMSNYRLKESLDSALDLMPSSRREEARIHSRGTIEDLAAVYEYLPDEMDDMSGTRRPVREALQFAAQAIAAAEAEAEAFIQLAPDELEAAARKTVLEELRGQ